MVDELADTAKVTARFKNKYEEECFHNNLFISDILCFRVC
jgi:hypothetical protein